MLAEILDLCLARIVDVVGHPHPVFDRGLPDVQTGQGGIQINLSETLIRGGSKPFDDSVVGALIIPQSV